jgi:hypothetical protein
VEKKRSFNPERKCTKVSLYRPKPEGVEEVEKKKVWSWIKSAKRWVKIYLKMGKVGFNTGLVG